MARATGLFGLLLLFAVGLLAWMWTVALDHYMLPPPPGNGPPHPLGDVGPYPGDKMDNLFWFMQVR